MAAHFVLTGRSLIAGASAEQGGESFTAYMPVNGGALEPAYYSATDEDMEEAVRAAVVAAPVLAATPGIERAKFLRRVADGIDAAAAQLVERAHLETALPKPRLTGEVGRTSNQLRLFAGLLEEGSWVNARIDTADASRTPPKPDVRLMLRPLGPVVVFGASNFPLAFSTAGGDTASALAAGNPVIFKAHPAHPGTGEIVGHIIAEAVRESGLPAGVFSLLFDSGIAIGAALVQHPDVRAVGFTGSYRGGRALMDLASKRAHPIPVYAEMGSTNPVFVLPGALADRGTELAEGLHASFTLGGGQFCTKPGMVFAEQGSSAVFTETLRQATEAGPAFSLLTAGIASTYSKAQQKREGLRSAAGAASSEGFSAQPILLETTGAALLSDGSLAEEVFGPTTLLVHLSGKEEMLKAARELEGHLTATILGTEADLEEYKDLLDILETKVGRVIFNAFPTGVEVCHAMVHGGPYPATSDGRSTSVGTLAILRFTRPVAYQGMPQSALPPELKDANPLGILRLVNGKWSNAEEKPA
jgi:NADP-dependent aldehyde dehydrogenase